ncbi:MAG: thioredoxin-disulfide reductase [Bacillota bacterium]|nr:thioredoxin-disulfide reductase [Bacillota bacterium]MDI7248692.1 thioredoxin-disulfide reductase [Bacillota bacterium]
MAEGVYDVVVLGAGPAGLTAAIYAGRARLDTVVIDHGVPGGQVATTDMVENYPGFPQGVSGAELAGLMNEQAERFGARIEMAEAEGLAREGDVWRVDTSEGPYRARAVIVATGTRPRELGVPGEKEFRGRGISYCATCDGAFFRDKPVVVVGGGDSAVTEAEFLTRFASHVTIVHRRDQLRAARSLQERVLDNPKISVRWNAVVTSFLGEDRLQRVRLRDVKAGTESEVEAEGAFIYVGLLPNTSFLNGVVPLDEGGYLVTDEAMALPVPGLFAAGDVRRKRLRQVATAVGDGAVAAMAAEEYIVGKFGRKPVKTQ